MTKKMIQDDKNITIKLICDRSLVTKIFNIVHGVTDLFATAMAIYNKHQYFYICFDVK